MADTRATPLTHVPAASPVFAVARLDGGRAYRWAVWSCKEDLGRRIRPLEVGSELSLEAASASVAAASPGAIRIKQWWATPAGLRLCKVVRERAVHRTPVGPVLAGIRHGDRTEYFAPSGAEGKVLAWLMSMGRKGQPAEPRSVRGLLERIAAAAAAHHVPAIASDAQAAIALLEVMSETDGAAEDDASDWSAAAE